MIWYRWLQDELKAKLNSGKTNAFVVTQLGKISRFIDLKMVFGIVVLMLHNETTDQEICIAICCCVWGGVKSHTTPSPLLE